MVHRAVNQKNPDGSFAHPNLRQYDPGRPTRADQMRETTRNAISDMYNGESEIYSSLRAAAYVMAQMVYVPEQETSFETLQHMSNMMETGLGGLSEKIRQADIVGVEEFGF